jgi:hypothetical protein
MVKKKKMYHVFGHGIRSQILELYHHLFFFLDNSMVRGGEFESWMLPPPRLYFQPSSISTLLVFSLMVANQSFKAYKPIATKSPMLGLIVMIL